VPDFPKPGVLFYDITTLLKDPHGLKSVIDGLSAGSVGMKIDTVVGIEARGFIFAPAVAYALHAGFVPVRKIVDDVLATGGTAEAVAKLVKQLGGEVVGLHFVIELDFLSGREKLLGYDVQALVHY
jgi:adenine phosphoribosyltransferase